MRMQFKALMVCAFVCLAILSPLFMVKPAAGASQVTLPTITIQADGSVSPADVPIHQSGNTYTFTGNIYGALNIFKSNIVLNGAGYALRGSFSGNSTDIWIVGTGPSPTLAYYTIGVDLANGKVDGVTVENLNIENFSIGAYVWTKNNTVAGNSFSRCIVGLLMSGSNSTITRNYIANNIEGLFFGFNSPSGQFPPDMVVYENAFINNNKQISGCQCKAYNMSETPHDWDNGKVGNYWSDYNCTSSHNGVGDTPYVIDVLDRDLYPLMQNPVKPPAPPQQVSLPVEAIVVAVFVSAALAVAFLAFWRRRGRKTERSEKLESISLTNSEWPLSHLRGT